MFVLTTLTTVALQQMFGGQFSVLEEVVQTVFSPRVPLPLFHLVLLPGLAHEPHVDPAGFRRWQEDLP